MEQLKKRKKILKEGFKENQNMDWGANLYLTNNERVAYSYGNTIIQCEINDDNIVKMSIDDANKIGMGNLYDKCIKENIKCLDIIYTDGKSFEIFIYDKSIVKPIKIIRIF